jgi:tryptophan synthase alpha chain
VSPTTRMLHGDSGKGSLLEQVFRTAQNALIMPYAVGGYPDLDSCLEVLRAYRSAGAELMEIGIPFSDPLADGPVVQAASQVALKQGVRPQHVLDLAGQVAAEGGRVVLLSYLNTILAFGPQRFFDVCRDKGVLGVTIPDLPAEEAIELQSIARACDVDVVLLAAPTSTEARLARIAAAASGFIYCVPTTGVTGTRSALNVELPAFIGRLRRYTTVPLVVGFEVSTAAQAASVAAYADGVMVGSALVDLVTRGEDLTKGLDGVRSLLGEMKAAIIAGGEVSTRRRGHLLFPDIP